MLGTCFGGHLSGRRVFAVTYALRADGVSTSLPNELPPQLRLLHATRPRGGTGVQDRERRQGGKPGFVFLSDSFWQPPPSSLCLSLSCLLVGLVAQICLAWAGQFW